MTNMREIGILYTPENIRAIAEKRKWMTRRVIVPQPESTAMCPVHVCKDAASPSGYSFFSDRIGTVRIQPRYRVGDILYVKEAWGVFDVDADEDIAIGYVEVDGVTWFKDRAKELHGDYRVGKLRSPLFMPKWAARPELKRRVTDVTVERVRDISKEDVRAEGLDYNEYLDWREHTLCIAPAGSHIATFIETFRELWDSINAQPKPVYERAGSAIISKGMYPVIPKVSKKKVITHYVSYPWQDIEETREHRGKPWYVCGNPYVFVYSFEEL